MTTPRTLETITADWTLKIRELVRRTPDQERLAALKALYREIASLETLEGTVARSVLHWAMETEEAMR